MTCFATNFTVQLIKFLNSGRSRASNPVFKHGAQAQNSSFTQVLDKSLAVFCPGLMTPISLNRVLLPGVLHDLSRHGYEVVRNPKWMNGSLIEIEDMGRAPEKFAKDGEETGGTVNRSAALRREKPGGQSTVLHLSVGKANRNLLEAFGLCRRWPRPGFPACPKLNHTIDKSNGIQMYVDFVGAINDLFCNQFYGPADQVPRIPVVAEPPVRVSTMALKHKTLASHRCWTNHSLYFVPG